MTLLKNSVITYVYSVSQSVREINLWHRNYRGENQKQIPVSTKKRWEKMVNVFCQTYSGKRIWHWRCLSKTLVMSIKCLRAYHCLFSVDYIFEYWHYLFTFELSRKQVKVSNQIVKHFYVMLESCLVNWNPRFYLVCQFFFGILFRFEKNRFFLENENWFKSTTFVINYQYTGM